MRDRRKHIVVCDLSILFLLLVERQRAGFALLLCSVRIAIVQMVPHPGTVHFIYIVRISLSQLALISTI